MKRYGDDEHGEVKKCLVDLFQVEIVVGLTLVKYGYIIANKKSSARGARTHHLPICRQMRYKLGHTSTIGRKLKDDMVEIS